MGGGDGIIKTHLIETNKQRMQATGPDVAVQRHLIRSPKETPGLAELWARVAAAEQRRCTRLFPHLSVLWRVAPSGQGPLEGRERGVDGRVEQALKEN